MTKILIEVKDGIVTRVRSTDQTLHVEVVEEHTASGIDGQADAREASRNTHLRDEYNGLPLIYP